MTRFLKNNSVGIRAFPSLNARLLPCSSMLGCAGVRFYRGKEAGRTLGSRCDQLYAAQHCCIDFRAFTPLVSMSGVTLTQRNHLSYVSHQGPIVMGHPTLTTSHVVRAQPVRPV